MQGQALRRRFSVEDFHRMAEAGVFGEDDRLELLDGEIVEMVPIGSRHAACVNRLNELLGERCRHTAIVHVQNPVVLSERTELYPDVALLRRRSDFYRDSLPSPTAVLLIIEVADTTGRYDRGVKVPRYAHAGIPEVWVVDLQKRAVDVYRQPAGEMYRDHQRLGPGRRLSPSTMPSLDLSVSELLA